MKYLLQLGLFVLFLNLFFTNTFSEITLSDDDEVMPILNIDTGFYGDPGTTNNINLYSSFINTNSTSYSSNYAGRSETEIMPYAPFLGESRIVGEIFGMMYSDFFKYSWDLVTKKFTNNQASGLLYSGGNIEGPKSGISGPMTSSRGDVHYPATSFYPGIMESEGNGFTCFSKDECIGFGGIKLSYDPNNKPFLESTDDYYYLSGSGGINGNFSCNIARQCVTGCKKYCSIASCKEVIDGDGYKKQECTYANRSSPKCSYKRAGCRLCTGKICRAYTSKIDPETLEKKNTIIGTVKVGLNDNCSEALKGLNLRIGYSVRQSGFPSPCKTACKESDYSRYWFNPVKEPVLPSPRHYPRFRKIDGKIYMIGGWTFSPLGNNIKGQMGDIRSRSRSYINEVWEFEPEKEVQCPNSYISGTGKKVVIDFMQSNVKTLGSRWTRKTDLISSDGNIIDLISVGGNIKKVIQKGDGIYIDAEKILDGKRDFFNSQVHCNVSNCYYSISGGIKDSVDNKFENPRPVSVNFNNSSSDFISDFNVWELTSSSVKKLSAQDRIPENLPKKSFSFGSGRIFHQVIMGTDEVGGLSFSVYGGNILDRFDLEKNPIPGSYCTFADNPTGIGNNIADTIHQASCIWSSPRLDCEESTVSSTPTIVPFRQSDFLNNDGLSFYTWTYQNPKWRQFNFITGEVIEDNVQAEGGENFLGVPVKNNIRESKNPLSFILDDKFSLRVFFERNWSWEYHQHHRCGRRACSEWHWITMVGSSKIPFHLKGAKESDNIKVNLLPIQTYSHDNKLTVSGNFDFSDTTNAGDDYHKNDKAFIGAIFKEFSQKDFEMGEVDQGLNDVAFLNSVIDVQNTNIKIVQCLAGATPDSSNACMSAGSEGLDGSTLPPAQSQPVFNPKACVPQASPKKVYRPPLTLNKNPIIQIKEPQSVNSGYEKIKILSDGSKGNKGSFSVTKEFSPGWHRIHIGLFAIENEAKMNRKIKAGIGSGFFGSQPKWDWDHKSSGIVKAKEMGLNDFKDAGFIPIYYKTFLYEFYVPEITNYSIGGNAPNVHNIFSNNFVIKGDYVPNGSQMFFYSGSGTELFRLNDIPYNVPIITSSWDYSPSEDYTQFDSSTSDIVKNQVILHENSLFSHNIRAGTNESSDIKGSFSYKPQFAFSPNSENTLSYVYIDDIGNTIGGKKFKFKTGYSGISKPTVYLNHNLSIQDGFSVFKTNSLLPFINGSYIFNKKIKAVITGGGSYFDEIIINTDNVGFFTFKPNKKLESGVYNLSFFEYPNKPIGSYKVSVSSSALLPEIVNIKSGDLIFSKRPIILGNSKPRSNITIEIYKESQGDTSLKNVKCNTRYSGNGNGIYECSILGKMGLNNMFTSMDIVSDQNGNFSLEIDKDLVSNNSPNENIYFIKVYNNNDLDSGSSPEGQLKSPEGHYDLVSFRYVDLSKLNVGSSIEKQDNDYAKIEGNNVEVNLGNSGNNTSSYSGVLILNSGEISLNGNAIIELVNYGFYKTNNDIVGDFPKGMYVINPKDLQLKILNKDLKNTKFLSGTIFISPASGGKIILKNLNENELFVSAKTLVYPFLGSLKVTFSKDISYFMNEVNRFSQFDCDKVFYYLNSPLAGGGRGLNIPINKENCIRAISTIYNENINSIKASNFNNGYIYLSGSGKYILSGNAWPNSKIRFRFNDIVFGTTTTDIEGRFEFVVPEEFKNDFFNSRIVKIAIDSQETNSFSEEIFVEVRKRTLKSGADKGELIDRSLRNFDNKVLPFNSSYRNFKLPIEWGTE